MSECISIQRHLANLLGVVMTIDLSASLLGYANVLMLCYHLEDAQKVLSEAGYVTTKLLGTTALTITL
jgi:hypothetical protein